jgi:tRNA nucleotidyltransferase (CCA-adding enzyme)
MGKDAEDITEGLNRLALIREMILQIEEEEGRFTLRNLAVNGQDLLQAGLAPGPVMGRILTNLLDLVLSEQLPNEKESLLAYARENLFPAQPENA